MKPPDNPLKSSKTQSLRNKKRKKESLEAGRKLMALYETKRQKTNPNFCLGNKEKWELDFAEQAARLKQASIGFQEFLEFSFGFFPYPKPELVASETAFIRYSSREVEEYTFSENFRMIVGVALNHLKSGLDIDFAVKRAKTDYENLLRFILHNATGEPTARLQEAAQEDWGLMPRRIKQKLQREYGPLLEGLQEE